MKQQLLSVALLSLCVFCLGVAALAVTGVANTFVPYTDPTTGVVYQDAWKVNYGFFKYQICGNGYGTSFTGKQFPMGNDCENHDTPYNDQSQNCGNNGAEIKIVWQGVTSTITSLPRNFPNCNCKGVQGMSIFSVVINGFSFLFMLASAFVWHMPLGIVACICHLITFIFYGVTGFYLADTVTMDAGTSWGFTFIMIWMNAVLGLGLVVVNFLAVLSIPRAKGDPMEGMGACDDSAKDSSSPRDRTDSSNKSPRTRSGSRDKRSPGSSPQGNAAVQIDENPVQVKVEMEVEMDANPSRDRAPSIPAQVLSEDAKGVVRW